MNPSRTAVRFGGGSGRRTRGRGREPCLRRAAVAAAAAVAVMSRSPLRRREEKPRTRPRRRRRTRLISAMAINRGGLQMGTPLLSVPVQHFELAVRVSPCTTAKITSSSRLGAQSRRGHSARNHRRIKVSGKCGTKRVRSRPLRDKSNLRGLIIFGFGLLPYNWKNDPRLQKFQVCLFFSRDKADRPGLISEMAINRTVLKWEHHCTRIASRLAVRVRPFTTADYRPRRALH